jgi:hypothetical protein
LLSPTELATSPKTPTSFCKKWYGDVLPSPEPSPEAGAYVGQHSQGLGGHYADSYGLAGNLFGILGGDKLANTKRRKSNET